MANTHRVTAAELNLGDVSSSGREFQGAVIFVDVNDEKKTVQIFTDLKRAPKDKGYEVSPHWGWWFSPTAEIEVDTGESEKVRERWTEQDLKMPEYGQQVQLEHRKALAQQKAHNETE